CTRTASCAPTSSGWSEQVPGRHEGRVAAVTGAASGIGWATARRLGAEGAAVVVNDIDPERADRAVAELHDAGVASCAHHGDVGDPTVVEALVAAAVTRFGRLDVMHNNAGGQIVAPLADLSHADLAAQLDVIVHGTLAGIRAAAAVMVDTGGG